MDHHSLLNSQIPITFDDHDKLGRKQLGIRLLSYLSHQNSGAVVALTGDWGSGKSTFIEMLRNLEIASEVDGEGSTRFPTIVKLDAFKFDCMEDPLLPLISVVLRELSDSAEPEQRSKLKQTAMRIFRASRPILVEGALRQLARTASAGLLTPEAIQEAGIAAEKAAKDDYGFLEQIEEVAEYAKEVTQFRRILSELSEARRERGEPLIIAIDELDRCRPSFAVRLLERVKHYFDVRGVGFILAYNTKQMNQSINHIYGAGIDASQYVQKFISFTVPLDSASTNSDFNTCVDFVDSYFRRLGLTEDLHLVAKPLAALTITCGLQPRSIEKIAQQIEFYQMVVESERALPAPFVVLGAFLKIEHFDAFTKFLLPQPVRLETLLLDGSRLNEISIQPEDNSEHLYYLRSIQAALVMSTLSNVLLSDRTLAAFGCTDDVGDYMYGSFEWHGRYRTNRSPLLDVCNTLAMIA